MSLAGGAPGSTPRIAYGSSIVWVTTGHSSARYCAHAISRSHPRRHHAVRRQRSVDLDALAGNARSLLDAGLTGLVGNGTMGEAGSLSADERRSVIEALVDAAGDRVTVTAGVSAQTAEAASPTPATPPPRAPAR